MAKDTDKTPFFNHEHPMYGWAALAVASLIIVGLAGWYLLVYQQGLDEELLLTVKQSSVTKEVSSNNATNLNIEESVNAIDADMDSVSESDFNQVDLSDQSLEITN
jgi:hypothetical protein